MRIALLLLLSLPTWAATLQVGSGQTYSTIGACISAAVNGDICNVHAGTYTENPTISKQITVQSNSGDSPAIVGLVDITSDSVTFKGFDVSPSTTCTTYLVHTDTHTAITVSNNVTHGCTGGSGIYARNSTAVTISGNTSYGNDVGVSTISCHSTDGTYANGVTISNNTVHDNITDGMELHAQYHQIFGNTIYSNITTAWASTHPDGIQLLAGAADGFTAFQHARIYNNVIKNHTQNIFSEGTLSGQSSDTQDIWIFNNVLYNEMTTVNGVNLATLGGVNAMLKFSKDLYFLNNYLGDIGSAGDSVHVQDCYNGSVHIKNNIIANSVSYGVYVEDTADIASGELDYNLYNVTANDPVIWGATFYSTLAAFKSAVPTQEGHGLSGSPLTNALPTPTLQSGSPAIGTGANLTTLGVTALNSDKAGVARPGGSTAWDMGAFQFGSDTTPPVRSSGAPSGTISYATSITISLTTDEAATCKWSASAGVAYGSMTNTFSTTGSTSHSTSVSVSVGSNTFYVRCIDGSSNANTSDFTINFTVSAASSTRMKIGGGWKLGAGWKL